MRFWIACSVILFASAARAVDVDGIAKEHRPIVVTHDPGVEINVLYWQDGEPVLLPDDHLVRMETQTIWSAPAGTYAVIRQGSSIVQVTRDGNPKPDPEPRPDPKPEPPDPQPDPAPDGIRAAWLVVIEEQAERSQHSEFFTELLSQDTRQFLADLQIQLRVYDDDQAAAKPFLEQAVGKRPAIILMNEDGSEIRVGGKVDDIESWVRNRVVR